MCNSDQSEMCENTSNARSNWNMQPEQQIYSDSPSDTYSGQKEVS